MILNVRSSIPTFKEVTFHSGLNILVADKEPDASSGQTRNSAGKTSLIEIIHFLYGADCKPDSLFRTDALIEHSFTGTIEVAGSRLSVERCGKKPSAIYIVEGEENHPLLPLKTEKETGRRYVSNTDWRDYLGYALFQMPLNPAGSEFEESYTPSFRSMFAYFVRRRNSGAFLHPEKGAEAQQKWDYQVNLSYLFGLDWHIPFEFNRVRQREKTLEELKKAAKGGALGSVIGTVAELRPQVTVAETKAAKLRSQLDNFEVLDSYQALATRAANLKTKMQELSRGLVSARETLNHLEAALAAENPPAASDISSLYASAGVELPGLALRRFEEVAEFYESVVRNRKVHLEREITSVSQRIASLTSDLTAATNERTGIMQTLTGRGAMEDFLSLQRNLAELEAQAASLRERFKAAEVLETETTQLDLDRVDLKRRLQIDHNERQSFLDQAILIVADAIDRLYKDRSGGFVVDATDNGPEFRITIEGDRGGGISNIEIFCFDLALFSVVSTRFGGPRFLVHDSHLFDGVDIRQIATALILGAETAKANNGQYIVTLNSDIYDNIPFPEDFDSTGALLETRLSDATDTGGLFGFRFD